MAADIVISLLIDEIVRILGHNQTKSLGTFFEMGKKAGRIISEKHSFEIIKFTTTPDIFNYISTKIWRSLFGKTLDVLKTNKQGHFIMIENNCSLLRDQNSSNLLLRFMSGVIHGFLLHSGLFVIDVQGALQKFPSCYFIIKLRDASHAG